MLAGYDEMSGFERDEDSPLQNSFELPAARLRREALGEDDDCEWKCAICPLADRSTRPEDLPPCIAEFREALAGRTIGDYADGLPEYRRRRIGRGQQTSGRL